jgi:tol-pal system protein YbgF
MRMLQVQIDEIQANQDAIQAKLDRIDSLALSGSAETREMVVDLKHSVEDLAVRVDQLDAQLVDVDQRIATGVVVGAAAAPLLIPAGTDAVSGGAAMPIDTASARSLYQQAFEALKREEYPAAISGFRAFVTQAPDAQEAASAAYWIGESFYAQDEMDSALAQFQSVLDVYPESSKVPAALFKAGNILSERGDKEGAYPYYHRLKEEYPQSLEYQQLRRRLEE